MRKVLFFMLLLQQTISFAQGSDDEGTSFGIGVGTFHYTTSMYYYRFDGRPSRYNYPVHKLNRSMLILNGEKKGLWHAKSFRFDGVAEVMIGLGGKSVGDWLPVSETISDGGFSLGLGAAVKAAYPIETASLHLTPFLGFGPQLMGIYNNGKGLGKQFASNAYYNYSDGWTEYLVMLTGSLGCSFQFSDFEIMPELRFGVAGFSATNWEPNEDGVRMESSPAHWGLSIKVNKRF